MEDFVNIVLLILILFFGSIGLVIYPVAPTILARTQSTTLSLPVSIIIGVFSKITARRN